MLFSGPVIPHAGSSPPQDIACYEIPSTSTGAKVPVATPVIPETVSSIDQSFFVHLDFHQGALVDSDLIFHDDDISYSSGEELFNLNNNCEDQSGASEQFKSTSIGNTTESGFSNDANKNGSVFNNLSTMFAEDKTSIPATRITKRNLLQLIGVIKSSPAKYTELKKHLQLRMRRPRCPDEKYTLEKVEIQPQALPILRDILMSSSGYLNSSNQTAEAMHDQAPYSNIKIEGNEEKTRAPSEEESQCETLTGHFDHITTANQSPPSSNRSTGGAMGFITQQLPTIVQEMTLEQLKDPSNEEFNPTPHPSRSRRVAKMSGVPVPGRKLAVRGSRPVARALQVAPPAERQRRKRRADFSSDSEWDAHKRARNRKNQQNSRARRRQEREECHRQKMQEWKTQQAQHREIKNSIVLLEKTKRSHEEELHAMQHSDLCKSAAYASGVQPPAVSMAPDTQTITRTLTQTDVREQRVTHRPHANNLFSNDLGAAPAGGPITSFYQRQDRTAYSMTYTSGRESSAQNNNSYLELLRSSELESTTSSFAFPMRPQHSPTSQESVDPFKCPIDLRNSASQRRLLPPANPGVDVCRSSNLSTGVYATSVLPPEQQQFSSSIATSLDNFPANSDSYDENTEFIDYNELGNVTSLIRQLSGEDVCSLPLVDSSDISTVTAVTDNTMSHCFDDFGELN